MLIPVILSGGSGTRLWPLSRKSYPKQFLRLNSNNSMLQQTIMQFLSHNSECLVDPIVVANNVQKYRISEQLNEIGVKTNSIILEPEGRNTMPACIVAALRAKDISDDASIMILPSDHLIENSNELMTAIHKAYDSVTNGALITFGIRPTYPSTEFGYIKSGQLLESGLFKVDGFYEKPSEEVAKEFIDDDNFNWNSGMFLFNINSFISEVETYSPECLINARKALEEADIDGNFISLSNEHFSKCENISVDYALMEKTKLSEVLPIDIGWSDIGNWNSLWEISSKDSEGNSISGDVIASNTRNSLIRASRNLVSVIDLEDVIVIDSGDATLVANKNTVSNIKNVIDQLKVQGRKEFYEHLKSYRPWGSYENIIESDRFKVKRIIVDPGKKLSLQMHHHRSEHWIVVSGMAKVQNGDQEIYLSEDESTYIPVATKHRLENPGKIPLELIEVQTGSYLEEDDIIRFDDEYGRS